MLKLALMVIVSLGIYYRFPSLEDRLLIAGAALLLYFMVTAVVREQVARRGFPPRQ